MVELKLLFTVVFGIVVGWMLASHFQPSKIISPTVENAGKITYIDKFGVCYRYRAVPMSQENVREQLG